MSKTYATPTLAPYEQRTLQAELVAMLGEYQSFVARLESGQRRIDVVELFELAEILKFDPWKIIAEIVRL